MIDLSRRHILIAGGSRGIGAAAARRAASAGAAVTITYANDQEAAAATVAVITAIGGRAHAVRADIAVDGAMDSAVVEAERAFGALDGLVVSAGIFEAAPIESMSTAFWDRIMNVNLRGTFLAVRSVVASLRVRGGGSIVIYTSTAGQRGSAQYSAYATAKGGQILFMRSMALELARDRIRCNCIAPSWTETEMSSATMDAIGRESILANCPLGRVGLPDDVAGATCFLLSDLATFITGSTLTVDGGIDMRG